MREAGSTAVQEIAFTLRERDRLHRGGARARRRRRRVRAAAVVDLQHPHQLLRGDRQVPRPAAPVGADHEGALRRRGPALDDAAHAHPDGRLDAHRAAAREQHRARRDPGAGRGARRRAVDGALAATTRRSRSRPRRRRRSRSAPSRSSPRRSASPTRSTRWRAPTTSSGSRTSSSGARSRRWTRSRRWAAPSRRSTPATTTRRSSTRPTSGSRTSTRASASSSA